MVNVYSNDSFSSVHNMSPPVAHICLTITDWLLEREKLLAHIHICVSSSCRWCDSAKPPVNLSFSFSFSVEST